MSGNERGLLDDNTTDLTPNFRAVRPLLAREKDYPAGEHEVGYDILVPLDQNGQLISAEWKLHQAACRVRRFRGGEDDRIGRLRRKPGGATTKSAPVSAKSGSSPASMCP